MVVILDDVEFEFNSRRYVWRIPNPDYVDYPIPPGYLVVGVGTDVERWIEQQPIYLWEPIDVGFGQYCVADSLYTLLMLKFG